MITIPGQRLQHALMPSRLFRRHIFEASILHSSEAGRWWDLVRICDSKTRRYSTSFLEDFSVEAADLSDPRVCPHCRSIFRPTGLPQVNDELDEYVTPPFDLFSQTKEQSWQQQRPSI